MLIWLQTFCSRHLAHDLEVSIYLNSLKRKLSMTELESHSNLLDTQTKLHSFHHSEMELELPSLSQYQTSHNDCKIRTKPCGLLEILPMELFFDEVCNP